MWLISSITYYYYVELFVYLWSKEVTMQSDPLVMAMYIIVTVPSIDRLHGHLYLLSCSLIPRSDIL